jgi:Clp amino terminal domain, pathogenicity island component
VTLEENALQPARDEWAVGPSTVAPTMFDRLTDRARRAVVLAREAAHSRGHSYIGTEHILLGLINEGKGVAAKVLESLGISLQTVRSQLEEMIGEGQQTSTDYIPFAPRVRKVLELSLREALDLGHDYIGTEHILLGLMREGEGVAAQVLVRHGTDLDRVRRQVIQLQQDYYKGKDDSSRSDPRVPETTLRHPAAPVDASHQATAAQSILDREARELLEAAVGEAQQAGDRELGGEHLLLAMCLREDMSWLVLRWAGAHAQTLMTAGLNATSNASPHHDYVPVSEELQRVLDDGWRAAGQQPLSPAALLAVLMRSGEPHSIQAVVEAGVHPQDILDAVVALSRLGEVDALAGQLARVETSSDNRPLAADAPDGAGAVDEQPEQGISVAQPAIASWAGPDREAAMSMRQFQLAVVSALYLPLVAVTVSAAVVAAIYGHRLWLLVLAPLAAVGNPTFGTWSLLPVAGLFWWLQVPIVAVLLMVSAPLDLVMGTLMRLKSDINNKSPESPNDLRIRARHVLGAFFLGVGEQDSDRAYRL